MGFETIMINSNPETVSTDFDTADRLYFEPLTLEHVLNIIDIEKPLGVIIQLGGQTPLRLAKELRAWGVTILGTSADNSDRAEDRMRARELFMSIGIKQPPSAVAYTLEQAQKTATELGYPLMIRPSYVLGGRAMQRVFNDRELKSCLQSALNASGDNAVLIDRFLDGAIELDVDALCDGTSVYVAGILQHIEEAGIHSGDSYGVLPPYDLSLSLQEHIHEATIKIALELNIIGFINIQFAVKDNILFVLEVNPRASRTIPFLTKAVGILLAQKAARIMCGELLEPSLAGKSFRDFMPARIVAVKAPVMPFIKFPHVDPLLGPEMRSTGEVMGLSSSFEHALLKSQCAAGIMLPLSGGLFVSLADRDKESLLDLLKDMSERGFLLYATAGTHWFLKAHHINSIKVNKVREGSPHAVDLLKNGTINLMFNTILGSHSVYDSHLFRKASLSHAIPYFSSVSAIKAAYKVIMNTTLNYVAPIISLQELHKV
jgi:carbamoyl-phosphate synthase large subunit